MHHDLFVIVDYYSYSMTQFHYYISYSLLDSLAKLGAKLVNSRINLVVRGDELS